MSLSIVHNLVCTCGQRLFEMKNLLTSSEERVNQVARERFEGNFLYQSFCSLLIYVVATLMGAGAFYSALMGVPMVSISLAISAIAVALFGYHRGNNPNQLMRSALREIENGNEGEALELIQKGANLDICSTETAWDFFPQLFYFMRDAFRGNIAVRMVPAASINVFDQAGYKGQKEILRYLASIGFDFKETNILQTGDSLEIIQYLVDELGMSVNVDRSRRFSPLYLQTILMQSGACRGDSFESIKERVRIIRYLLQKGASCEDTNIDQRKRELLTQILHTQPGEEEDILVQQIIDRR